jgi:hypothetical protein
MSARRPWRFACVGATALLLVALHTSVAGDDSAADVEAVWKQQQLSLTYRTAGAVHTCAGLRSQLRSLLILLGAHETLTVEVQGCEDTEGTRVVRIAIASPFERNGMPVSEQDATAQLIERLRRVDPATANAEGPFLAQWKTISFSNALSLRLTPADCELLRQLRYQVMPKLSVRVVSDRMRCTNDLASGNRPRLVVAALVAQPSRARL